MAKGFIEGALSVGKCIRYIIFYWSKIDWSHAGMTMTDTQPLIFWENGQGNIADVWFFFFSWNIRDADVTLLSSHQQLKKAGKACVDQKGSPPNLIVVVLPEGGNDIYTAVKKWAIYLPLACISSHRCLSYHLVSGTYRWVQSLFFSFFILKWCTDGCRDSMLEVEQM